MKSVDYWVVDSGSSQHIVSKKGNLVKGGNVICVCNFGIITGMDGHTKNEISSENASLELVEFRKKQVWEILVDPNSHSTTRTKWVFKC